MAYSKASQRYRDPVAVWFSEHHGIITTAEALGLGVSTAQIKRLVRSGRWRRIYPGVYLHDSCPFTPHAWIRAAVALGGPGAVTSHLSAAWLLGMASRPPGKPMITVPNGRVVRVTAIHATRSRRLPKPELVDGLPCTPATRTLLDCATCTKASDLDDLVDRAVARRVVTLDELIDEADRPGRHPGRTRLRYRLAARGATRGPNPSVLESRFARSLRSRGLPSPKAELRWGPAGRYRLDFAYPDIRLVIEVNGWAYHSSPEQVRADAARRNALSRAGWTFLAFDWWEVTYESERILAEVEGVILSRRAA